MRAEFVLARVPLFAGLTSDDLTSIVAAGRKITLGTGQMVFREGDASDGLYLILSGSVQVYKPNGDGTEVNLLTVGVSEYFGELALIDGGPRSASVESLEP